MYIDLEVNHAQTNYFKKLLASFLWNNHFSKFPLINFIYLNKIFNSLIRAEKILLRSRDLTCTFTIDVSLLIKMFP